MLSYILNFGVHVPVLMELPSIRATRYDGASRVDAERADNTRRLHALASEVPARTIIRRS